MTRMFTSGLLGILLSIAFVSQLSAQSPEQRFHVPGHEAEMESLQELFDLHINRAFTPCTLWDAWLPHSTLWTGPQPQQRYRNVFLNRRIDKAGYVSMQQHRGMAHSEGWPFPAWQQAGGSGWHFSTTGDVWAVQHFRTQPLRSLDGWDITGAEIIGFDDNRGLMLKIVADQAEVTTPQFRAKSRLAPFIRVEWARHGWPEKAAAGLSWKLEGKPWHLDRSLPIVPVDNEAKMHFRNLPIYKRPGFEGTLNRLRLSFVGAKGAEIDLKSIITAIDTRHPITGSLFLRGSTDYFSWTKDVDFLRQNVGRMRKALQFTLNEFDVRKQKHVVVPWIGHEGRTGISRTEEGKKLLHGEGVGNNYWDLLPFGGHDALATIYLYDALRRMANLEAAIADHPEWKVPAPPNELTHPKLTQLAAAIKAEFQERFWLPKTGRFAGWQDTSGKPYDYGFTFVNLEAIAYGLASEEQSQTILNWLDGERTVAGDTSTGADIYHWRFAPRATTRRNIDTYAWVWSNPEAIPWGGQVQDGGAVLGFSYHDLMARLETHGPDDAWLRLQTILSWFDDVQVEGGYREYYAKPNRGTLQGGGTAGGLGLDHEFMESVLVPQIMLYGFLGFEPTAESFEVYPSLPTDWPSLTVRNIHIGDRVVDITAKQSGEVIIEDR